MKALFTWRAALGVWGPMLAIAGLHYLSPAEMHWVHDVARRLFYVPILLAGTWSGRRGGLLAAGAVVLLYLPHAFWGHVDHMAHMDPGSNTEKLLELGFYLLIGGVSGHLAQRTQERQRELEAKDRQLERAARLEALGQLSAGLAHEIRNPLHAMRGTAEILLDAVPEDRPEHALGQAHIREIDRLSGVLARFLDYARAGGTSESAPVALDDVVRQVEQLLGAQAARDGVQVVVHAQGGRGLGDEEELIQVTLGLALNALQAGARRIELQSVGPEILVLNDGPAIPEPDLARLFDPFFTTRAEGTGLGLSVAWRIVDQHGGALSAENTPQGVRFRVRLRAADGTATAGRGPAAPGG